MVWFLPMDRLQVEFISQGRLAQRRLNDPTNLDDNRIPEGGTPGYVTYHARAAWRASDQMTARLSLDNLTDALVLEHGSGFYLQGRSATGSIDVAY